MIIGNPLIFITCSSDNAINIINSEFKIIRQVIAHKDYVRCICVLTNHLVATGSYDKTIRIFNINSGKRDIYIFANHILGINNLQKKDNFLLSAG